ncbi:GNAT family N-acetyltransferase [Leptotrichia sp. oral taxon 847]|uniref:GNAT family N-acetyltransferase n=1 Tax=Leptotrichia sp. oral taxon 847 TaxID=1785996 RepID=UPI00076802DD|nr:GNAT family N-acetyltransferase [Leptotrichia sp. oral taxon 847]AMD95202.1 phosphinothricin acetyltransferase [Leptotrichia sp. oral taxon 847]
MKKLDEKIINFRFATVEDAGKILEIYKPYVENTTITFEYDVPALEEFKNRIKNILTDYPYIVCEYENKILGYAYAHKVWMRAAYQWDAELSVYIDKRYMGNGLGKKLYKILIEILKLQNVVNVYGCVTYPNEKSDRLHESFGFKRVGIFENAGYKFGKWIGVTWFHKAISEYKKNPEKLKKISQIDKEKIKLLFLNK